MYVIMSRKPDIDEDEDYDEGWVLHPEVFDDLSAVMRFLLLGPVATGIEHGSECRIMYLAAVENIIAEAMRV